VPVLDDSQPGIHTSSLVDRVNLPGVVWRVPEQALAHMQPDALRLDAASFSQRIGSFAAQFVFGNGDPMPVQCVQVPETGPLTAEPESRPAEQEGNAGRQSLGQRAQHCPNDAFEALSQAISVNNVNVAEALRILNGLSAAEYAEIFESREFFLQRLGPTTSDTKPLVDALNGTDSRSADLYRQAVEGLSATITNQFVDSRAALEILYRLRPYEFARIKHAAEFWINRLEGAKRQGAISFIDYWQIRLAFQGFNPYALVQEFKGHPAMMLEVLSKLEQPIARFLVAQAYAQHKDGPGETAPLILDLAKAARRGDVSKTEVKRAAELVYGPRMWRAAELWAGVLGISGESCPVTDGLGAAQRFQRQAFAEPPWSQLSLAQAMEALSTLCVAVQESTGSSTKLSAFDVTKAIEARSQLSEP